MNIHSVWAVAAAEMRLDRRLARTWVFIFFTLFFCAIILINNFTYYAISSATSSTTLMNSPLMTPFQLYPTLIGFLAIWVIFFAFDVRARDKRERLDEVVGVLPLSNLGLVCGRALGITVLMLIPLLVMIALYWIGGFAARLSAPASGFKEPELYVTLATVLIDAIPNILFWVALVMAITLLVRLRVIVVAIAIGLIALVYWAQNNLPIYALNTINTYTATAYLPSEVAPQFTSIEILVQRVGMLLASFAFLCLTAALYPRLDPQNKPRLFISATALLIFSALSFAIVNMQFRGIYDDRMDLAAVHKPLSEMHQFDLESLHGRVDLNPGDDTQIDLTLTLKAIHPISPNDDLFFSLNPGYEITSLKLNNSTASHEFHQGLLTVKAPAMISPTRSLTLAVQAVGEIDANFAYLDSAVDTLSADVFQAFGLLFQGSVAAINSSHYVALPPALAWYPMPGSHYHRDLKHIRPRDFYTVNLDVVVPPTWHVAGPGKSEIHHQSDTRVVSFLPAKPTFEIALFAAEFERRTTEIAGIEFELLVTPEKTRNLDLFASALDELKTHVEEILDSAKRAGLDYPYRSFTLVETPINLRAYGGGWRMDTTQSYPGIFAIREGSFLDAGFGNVLDHLNEDKELSEEEKLERTIAYITNYFENDVNGGNVYLAAANNVMQYQTDTTGPGAIPLSYLMNFLARNLTTEMEGFYSSYVTIDVSSTATTSIATTTIENSPDDRTVSDLFFDWNINQPDVWDAMLEKPLAQIAYDDLANSKSNLHVLHLWGRTMGHLVRDWIGDEQLADLLSTIRSRYEGTSYTYNDVIATAQELGIDLPEVLGNWLTRIELAGFRASPVSTVRLPDQAYGVPLYESSFNIENAEPASGLITIEYGTGEREGGGVDETQPIKLPGHSAVHIALTSEEPLEIVRINPYLSYNRTTFSLHSPRRRALPVVERSERPLVQPVTWQLEDSDSIIVDDLDSGFSVDEKDETVAVPWFLRLATAALNEPPDDQGLKSFGSTPLSVAFNSWARQQLDQAYGKYRRTLARAFKDASPANAHFEAQLPATGSWKLEYHLPHPNVVNSNQMARLMLGASANVTFDTGRRERKWGDFKMWVTNGGQVYPIDFDGESINEGWNTLGEFEIQNPTVTVSVSTKSTRGSVVADAIRWTPTG